MNAKSIIPYIGYKDAPASIDWLCNAFGFEKRLVVLGENGIVIHSELTLGNAMIMIGSSENGGEFSKLIKHPAEVDGFETQSPYIVIDDSDIDKHYARAKAFGAKMFIDLKEEDYGGKGYSCHDPEGHLWSFGSYDPWKQKSK